MRKFGFLGFVTLALVAAFVMAGRASPQDSRAAAAISKDSVLNDPATPTVAPAGHDVTLVLFFDYQCSVCRRVHPDIQRLRQQDGRIRMVYKDWPIFGGVSEQAARVAIAAHWQGRYEAVHDGLMRMPGRLDAAKIRTVALQAGVDWKRLERDMAERKPEIDALLARTQLQAAALGLQGTPSFIIGPYLVPGALDLPDLSRIVGEARKRSAG